jgi:hypothetical protein
LIEATSGQSLSSITLYNLGKLYDIRVSCLISKYDNDNKVIPNSAAANFVKFDMRRYTSNFCFSRFNISVDYFAGEHQSYYGKNKKTLAGKCGNPYFTITKKVSL